MNKKYEVPQADILYIHVMDTVTSEGDAGSSGTIPDDPQYGFEPW